jgi:Na+/proline symporter/nitrogen-specific signal transduction histidine kinase
MTPASQALPTLPTGWVLGASFAYLALLFAVAAWADRRARQGRSVIDSATVYALSLGVYCTAWTYFGSVGRAASSGIGFLPIYLGPTLAMVLAAVVLRKMIRIAREQRITSIADFIASRYGKSRALAGLVTLIALVGVVPYVALQLKGIAVALSVMTGQDMAGTHGWHGDGTLYVALLLAGFIIAFGTRHLDTTERHEGMVAAIAAESVVKLLAFVAVGLFAVFALFDGPSDLLARARAVPEVARVLEPPVPMPGDTWLALVLLAMLSVLMLPRQFQVMVVENVDERHVRRAAWAFPAYLLAINVFVLPVALAGLLTPGLAGTNPEMFVLTLPLSVGEPLLALLAFVGGLSAATGMVIVEAIAVSTMVSNDLVLPLLMRRRDFFQRHDLTGVLKGIRRAVIVALLMLGYVYYRVAGEAYALVSIGLISFAAVAQFAPSLLGGLYWKGGTRAGALAGLLAGALLWGYTLLLPSLVRSGWVDGAIVRDGLAGLAWLRPEALLGIQGMDNLTHALFFSLTANALAYVTVSLIWPADAREAGQALRFVDVFERGPAAPVFWRGRARVADLQALLARFLGADRARTLMAQPGARTDGRADAALVHHAETHLAGAIGSASARVMVASVTEEEHLSRNDVLAIVEEAGELRQLNEQLKSVDKLKDDFMSSVTHELRTPLTSIRAFAELMRDDATMPAEQRAQFLGIIVAESERLSRLVNQVLDLAKIESGHAEWCTREVDLRVLLQKAVAATSELFRERGATVRLVMPDTVPPLQADADRLTQVVVNLLSNAAKFVPQGHGQVDVSLRCDDVAASVCVSDNGPGIPAAQHKTIFEKFRQGGDDRHRPQGTGLGLPISRQIIEHFGGRLWLDHQPGPGARFCFSLPWTGPQESTS